jgi:beta-N-acetylhexosaminidase
MKHRTNLPLGPIMLDVAGPALTPAERELLVHPSVGGVILFARNYESPAQLDALTADIAALRSPSLLIAVDHEGGRVQRFREGFTRIPPMRSLGELWDRDEREARAQAAALGRTIALELGGHGVDFSFTPVLDLDYSTSAVIGDRSFHRQPHVVAALAASLIQGLHDGGMAAVGKHFPGHGYVAADSHVDAPVDSRSYEQIEVDDLVPFSVLAPTDLDGVMPAHVIYPDVDDKPAGFSPFWLQELLRGRLGFDGVIFSDDLAMAGARGMGDVVGRAQAASEAGCDMVLICNQPEQAGDLIARWTPPESPKLAQRLERMRRG